MRYLKLYEDFNTDKLKIKDLLEDIVALDYILSDEGIKAKYYVTEKVASDSPNTYMIGTSDDISTKVDDSFDGVGIYKIQVYFDIDAEIHRHENSHTFNQKEIPDEYFNQLKEHLEEVYDVHVVKDRPYTTGRIKRDGDYGIVNVNCVSVIVERQPDDYIYFNDEEDINESVDDETAMKHYGLYPEDVKEMFYDLQDLDIFPERLRVFVEFKSMLGQNGNLMFNDPMSASKMTFQHFPFIEVRVKSDAISVPEYGRTQADRNMIQSLLTKMTEDERFKEVIEVANNRLEDYDWKIEKIYKDFGNDFIQIIIKKITN
jgi:hypothetical protein